MSRITRLTGLMAGAALSCQTPSPEPATTDPLKETHADRVSTVAGEIDRVLDATYAKEGIVPTGRADDAHFVRRVYLDVIGTIPAPETVTAFLADTSPEKRSKLVEALLRDPRYGEHWSQYWEALLLGRKFREQIVDRRTFRTYLKSRFDANTAWNTVAYELIDAQGQNSFGALTPEMAAPEAPADTAPGMGTMMAASGSNSMAAPEMSSGTPAASAGKGSVNGAVNWLLRFDKNPADLAGTVSKLFLGMQIQCAQCHDHPTEKWKQQDFRRFAACFTRTKVQQIDKGKIIGPRRVAVE